MIKNLCITKLYLKWDYQVQSIRAVCTSFLAISVLAGCAINPATGERQFTALMSPQQELQVGASEHKKITAEFGVYKDQRLQNYVNEIGQRVAKDTERSDVNYTFTILDSPIVNAFALPGGYVYVSRGLLALANSEAELAAVLAHEVAHITGRHSAERYSTGVVTSLGANVLAAAVGEPGVSQALGLGTNLYLSSYSRGQEEEADTLGIRYLDRAAYNPQAMSAFLQNLKNHSELQDRISGKGSSGFNYFSTHPATGDRVQKTRIEAQGYPQHDVWLAEKYLQNIDGIVYGDSARQGFARGQSFFHPDIGFTFDAPDGYELINQPSQVIARSKKNDAVMVFDFGSAEPGITSASYLSNIWMKDQRLSGVETITINGQQAATGSFPGVVNGKNVTIRLVAIRWDNSRFARFQIALPAGLSSAELDSVKKSTYSFRRLSNTEKASIRPYRIEVVAAGPSDTVASLSSKLPYETFKEERFRVLNGLGNNDRLKTGGLYKIISP